MLSRNQEQEKIMFILYQALFYHRMEKEFDIVNIIEDVMEEEYSETSLFVKEVSIKVLNHFDEIRSIIEPNCRSWKYERINLIVIAILYLGIGEFKYVGNVDRGVIIDVCVRLCKKYADEKDYRFVNALLDNVL